MSPDPLGLRGADLKNPTSWNRYAYVNGDPINYSDSGGMQAYWSGGSCGAPGTMYCEADGLWSGSIGLLTAPIGYDGEGGAIYGWWDPFPTDDFIGSGASPVSGVGDGGLSQDCLQALAADKKNASAVTRAQAAYGTLTAAVEGTGVDWRLLAAIGIRESGFQDVTEVDGAGIGVGIFQLTVSPMSGVSAKQAHDLETAANYAALQLGKDLYTLSMRFPNFTKNQLAQATAAAFNFGIGNISGNPNTIDVGTARGDYGSNVMKLMDCFH